MAQVAERFFILPVKGTGVDEDDFRPAIPKKPDAELEEYCDWQAKYYPAKPPYSYCIVRCWNFRKPPEVNLEKAEKLFDELTVEYKAYLAKARTVQAVADPAPESWNFDSDTTGSLPSGWSESVSGIYKVSEDYYVSSAKSLKAFYYSTYAFTWAGSSRTDAFVQAKQRYPNGSAATDNWKNAGVLIRWASGSSGYLFYVRIREGLSISQVRLRRYDSGSSTNLSTVTITTPTDETWYDIRLEAQDENGDVRFKCYWDDLTTEKINYLESPKTYNSGYCGVGTYQSTSGSIQGHYWDDVQWEDLGGAVTKTVSDSAAGSETLALEGAISLSDTAAGSESLELEGNIPTSDQGAGSESLSVQGQVSLAESALGSELLNLETRVPLAESALGSEAINFPEKYLVLLESALGSETVNRILQAAPITIASMRVLSISLALETRKSKVEIETRRSTVKLEVRG